MTTAPIRIGTAGWSIPKDAWRPPVEGSHPEPYVAVFNVVEITRLISLSFAPNPAILHT